MKREIPSLYILKLMSCVLILFIHTQPFSSLEWNTFVVPLTRIGVPLFFMVTVFFMYEKLYLSDQSYTGFDASKKSIKKLIKIFVASSLLFLVFELIVDGKDEICGNISSLKRWIYFVFMNVPFWGGHLWYVLADLYMLKPVLGGGILIVALLLGRYQFLFGLNDLPQTITRNWLFTGFPFFIFGWGINQGKWDEKVKTPILIGSVFFFSILCVLEANILGKESKGDLYLFSPFLAVSLFCLFLKIKNKQLDNWFLCYLGKRHTLWIYVFHVMVIKTILTICDNEGVCYDNTLVIMFPVILLSSLLLSYLMNKIKLV